MCEGLMAGFSWTGASGIGEKTPLATQKVSLKGPKLYLSLEVHLVEGAVGTRKITLSVIKRYHWEKVRDYREERLTDDPYPGRVRGLLRRSETRNVSESLLFLGIRIWAHDACKRSPAGSKYTRCSGSARTSLRTQCKVHEKRARGQKSRSDNAYRPLAIGLA